MLISLDVIDRVSLLSIGYIALSTKMPVEQLLAYAPTASLLTGPAAPSPGVRGHHERYPRERGGRGREGRCQINGQRRRRRRGHTGGGSGCCGRGCCCRIGGCFRRRRAGGAEWHSRSVAGFPLLTAERERCFCSGAGSLSSRAGRSNRSGDRTRDASGGGGADSRRR